LSLLDWRHGAPEHGWLVNATAPETAITLVVAADAVMVAAFALVPAMRLVDAPAPARGR
jgi:hypothetical protein